MSRTRRVYNNPKSRIFWIEITKNWCTPVEIVVPNRNRINKHGILIQTQRVEPAYMTMPVQKMKHIVYKKRDFELPRRRQNEKTEKKILTWLEWMST